MKFFSNFCFHFGVLGKRTLNPEVLKCHEDLITLNTYVQQGKTMDNKFYIYIYVKTYLHLWLNGGPGGGGEGGASIVRLGPSWFTYIPSIYMS